MYDDYFGRRWTVDGDYGRMAVDGGRTGGRGDSRGRPVDGNDKQWTVDGGRGRNV